MDKIGERLIFLNEHGQGLLIRFYNIKKTCLDPKSRPSIFYDKTFDACLKLINKKFPQIDIKANMNTFTPISTNKHDIMRNFSQIYYTFVDFLDFKDHFTELLINIDATHQTLSLALTFDLTRLYLDLIYTYCSLVFLIVSIQDKKCLLACYHIARELALIQNDICSIYGSTNTIQHRRPQPSALRCLNDRGDHSFIDELDEMGPSALNKYHRLAQIIHEYGGSNGDCMLALRKLQEELHPHSKTILQTFFSNTSSLPLGQQGFDNAINGLHDTNKDNTVIQLESLVDLFLRRNVTAQEWRNANALSIIANAQNCNVTLGGGNLISTTNEHLMRNDSTQLKTLQSPVTSFTIQCEYLPLETLEQWIVMIGLVCQPAILNNNYFPEGWKIGQSLSALNTALYGDNNQGSNNNTLSNNPWWDLWMLGLRNNVVISLFRDECLNIYPLIFQHFDGIKGFGKRITEVKECLSIALNETVKIRREKRKYLRVALKELIQVFTDQPALLGPKCPYIFMAISWARDEIRYLIRHQDYIAKYFGSSNTTSGAGNNTMLSGENNFLFPSLKNSNSSYGTNFSGGLTASSFSSLNASIGNQNNPNFSVANNMGSLVSSGTLLCPPTPFNIIYFWSPTLNHYTCQGLNNVTVNPWVNSNVSSWLNSCHKKVCREDYQDRILPELLFCMEELKGLVLNHKRLVQRYFAEYLSGYDAALFASLYKKIQPLCNSYETTIFDSLLNVLTKDVYNIDVSWKPPLNINTNNCESLNSNSTPNAQNGLITDQSNNINNMDKDEEIMNMVHPLRYYNSESIHFKTSTAFRNSLHCGRSNHNNNGNGSIKGDGINQLASNHPNKSSDRNSQYSSNNNNFVGNINKNTFNMADMNVFAAIEGCKLDWIRLQCLSLNLSGMVTTGLNFDYYKSSLGSHLKDNYRNGNNHSLSLLSTIISKHAFNTNNNNNINSTEKCNVGLQLFNQFIQLIQHMNTIMFHFRILTGLQTMPIPAYTLSTVLGSEMHGTFNNSNNNTNFYGTTTNLNTDLSTENQQHNGPRRTSTLLMRGGPIIDNELYAERDNKSNIVFWDTRLPLLLDVGDLSFLCFYPVLFEEHFRAGLEFPPQMRFTIAFPALCAQFVYACDNRNDTNSMCPEERCVIEERSLTMANIFLEEIAREIRTLIAYICEDYCLMNEQTLPKNAFHIYQSTFGTDKINCLRGFPNNNKDKNILLKPYSTGTLGKKTFNYPTDTKLLKGDGKVSASIIPGSESYRKHREQLNVLDIQYTALTELCTALNHFSHLRIAGHAFCPREYLAQQLELYFNKSIVAMAMFNSDDGDENGTVARPSELLMRVKTCISLMYHAIENFVNIDVSRIVKNVLLQQSQPLDNHGEKTITSIYTLWYLEILLKKMMLSPIILSEFQFCTLHCTSTNISGGGIKHGTGELTHHSNTKESRTNGHRTHNKIKYSLNEYVDYWELKALAELLTPYGIKHLSEQLMRHTANQTLEIRKLVLANRDNLNLLRTNFDDRHKMKEFFKKFDYETLLQRIVLIGNLITFNSMCLKSMNNVLQDRVPFLLASISDFQNIINANSDLNIINEMASAAGMQDITNPYLLLAFKQNLDYKSDEEYENTCLLMILIAMSIPKLMLSPQLDNILGGGGSGHSINENVSTSGLHGSKKGHYTQSIMTGNIYNPFIDGMPNNSHNIAKGLNVLFATLFHLHGKGDLKERMKEFLALTSYCLLRTFQETEKENVNLYRDSLAILLEKFVDQCPDLTQDLLDACFPYVLIRNAYRNLNKNYRGCC